MNSQVIRPQEKALMNRLVDIMASLELRFVQERAEDGQLTYRLDPYVVCCEISYLSKDLIGLLTSSSPMTGNAQRILLYRDMLSVI